MPACFKEVTYSRPGTDNNNIGLGMVDHIGHVAASHFATDIGLADRVEMEIVKIVLGLADKVDGTEFSGGSGDGRAVGRGAVKGGHD